MATARFILKSSGVETFEINSLFYDDIKMCKKARKDERKNNFFKKKTYHYDPHFLFALPYFSIDHSLKHHCNSDRVKLRHVPM